jgi:(1->4)-alpha-D-glucan 1-alpha-D-glucosylmutase
MSIAVPTRPAVPPLPARDRPVEELAVALFEAEASVARPRPVSTYRLQLHKEFRLDQVTAVVDYLDRLGITDLYLSPYLDARPGSTHGYDVFDHARLNAEIGDEAAHARLIAALGQRGMGRVLDVVPNHMGVGGHNRYWLDVLELGQPAPSARYFDIDWYPIKEELEGRVLLPILEDQYGKVLESGKLRLERDGGALFVRYYETRLPLSPRSYALVLERRTEELLARFDPGEEHVLEYRSIWASARSLPSRSDTKPDQIEQTIRERDVIKRRLGRLCADCPELCAFIDENIAQLRGDPGDPSSFDPLHRILEDQVYRLAYWRVAAEEINYRRFFDINDLAGLRTEDPLVFETIHRLVFGWVDAGAVRGLRIDHPDGLADPRGYFARLQEWLFLRACSRRLRDVGRGDEWPGLEERVRARYREAAGADASSPLARWFPVVAEKILSRGEELPDDWPIDGTVGYEYLNALNGLFIDPTAAEAIDAAYAEFTGDREPFAEVLYQAKRLVTRASLPSEVNVLARQLNRVSEADRRSRDFTLNELRDALREVIACFPVYRTYIQPGRPASDRDRGYVDQAVARARRRNPTIDASLFAFLREALLLEHPEGASADDRALRERFVVRFQQTTGPVQAKGLEDTAFYRQVKLASASEVGADPARFGNSPSVFHAMNAQRLSRWPGTLGTTATHDTKRGEDTRIRIDALSELAGEWPTHLARWSRWNARRRATIDDAPAPDAREEYLFYQVALGAWPFGGPDDATPPGLVERLQLYMVKAVREAKVHTTWTDPDRSYADAVAKFVADVLEGPDAGPFLKDFIPFARRIARIGIVHSLSQTLLKLASPGVPDIYQGCELWDSSLVDPDNRRPVDYELRRRLLGRIEERLRSGASRRDLAAELLAAPEDGAIKLYLACTLLRHRRNDPELYAQGSYRPLDAEGPSKANVVAFGRHREGRYAVAIVSRLVASLMGAEAEEAPIGPETWGETCLLVPDLPVPRRWRDLLTDNIVEVREMEGRPVLSLAEVFQTLPVALLVGAEGSG